MSIVSTLTPLMDKARKLTGLTEKISIARLTSLMDHFDLHVVLSFQVGLLKVMVPIGNGAKMDPSLQCLLAFSHPWLMHFSCNSDFQY